MALDQTEAIKKLDLGARAAMAMMKELGVVTEKPEHQDAGGDDKSNE